MFNIGKRTVEPTKYWKLYEKGLDYVNRKLLVGRTDRNWNFYAGRQWVGVKTNGEELPSLNFIKPVIKHKVSTVSQNTMVAHFSDAEGREEMGEVYAMLDQKFTAAWEHSNMDEVLWSTIKDAAVTGDGILYFGTEHMQDVQRLPNTCVLYGDESETDIQKQPYIIIHQRLLVSTVRKMALENGVPAEDLDLIVPDQETEYTVGNRDEVQDDQNAPTSKVTVLFYFTRDKSGVVNVAKCTKSVVIEEIHPIAARNPDGSFAKGMTLYPILKYSWEDFPNDARGVSEVEQLIPNQLEVNKTLARRSMIIKLTAYPRLAYIAGGVINPEALNEVGMPIEVNAVSAQSVNQMISYLNPAQSNSDPKNYADDLMNQSQDLAGAGDTAMGNINPTRVAASAILAIRDQAALPLNEQVAKMKTFVEQYAKLAIEIWAVYNPGGMNVLTAETDENGNEIKTMKKITKEDWDKLKADVRIDTSKDSPWSIEAMQGWLDGVLDKGYITFEDYIDAAPENSIIPKNKMKNIIAKQAARQAAQEAAQAAQAQQEQQEQNDVNAYANAVWSQQEQNG